MKAKIKQASCDVEIKNKQIECLLDCIDWENT